MWRNRSTDGWRLGHARWENPTTHGQEESNPDKESRQRRSPFEIPRILDLGRRLLDPGGQGRAERSGAQQTALQKYNVSPSRGIHAGDSETYRPIGEIVATARRDSASPNPEGNLQSVPAGQDELDAIEAEAKETAKALRKTLKHLGV